MVARYEDWVSSFLVYHCCQQWRGPHYLIEPSPGRSYLPALATDLGDSWLL